MVNADAAFAGSIPELYDRYLGPLLFEPYAADLAERARAIHPKRVLETAAGTGIVTRALLRSLGANVEIVATDLNQSMLDHAGKNATADNLRLRQADALQLPFADGEFDLVACQFGAMFFPDKTAAYREARRVLRLGGCFVFNVWDKIEENEVADLVAQGVASLFAGDPPNFLARTPYGHFDLGTIERNLRAAGFTRIETTTLANRSRAPSPRHPAVGLCQGTPLRGEIEAREKTGLERATESATRAVAKSLGPGPIDGKMQAHVIVAG